jgi:hypothetical protein
MALQAAFHDRLWLSRERIFYLLSFLYEPAVVLRARDNLQQASLEKRAYALEVIDTLIAQALKPFVLPLLDELSSAQRLHGERFAVQLSLTVRNACASFVAGRSATVAAGLRLYALGTGDVRPQISYRA